jgi:Lon protease-like protein
MTALPMFPLGTVLLPGMVLPLHVFEDRYRRMMHDCLAGDREFGVTLIARGSEVGGGDVRTDVGAVASIVEAAMADDGRWLCVGVGTRRIRVLRWLDDDPYPRAEVDDWRDPPGDPAPDEAVLHDVVARLRRVLAWKAELGRSAAPVAVELSVEPVLATWQVAAASGMGPLDLHRVLGTERAAARLALVDELLRDDEQALQAELAGD